VVIYIAKWLWLSRNTMKSVSCSYIIHPSWFTNGSWFTLAVVYIPLAVTLFFCMEVWFLETSHNQTQEFLDLSVSLIQETNQFPVVSVVWLLFTHCSIGYIYILIPVLPSLYIKTNVKIAQVFGGNLTEWKKLSTGGRRFKKWKAHSSSSRYFSCWNAALFFCILSCNTHQV